MMNLDLNLRRGIQWIFMVASVPFAIIGIDFLRHFGLLVDAGRHRLLDDNTKLGVDGVYSDAPIISPVFRIADAPSDNLRLLSEHPRLVRPTAELPPVTTEVAHHIVTRGQPVNARPRRLAPDKLRAARAEFDNMLQLGIKVLGDWRPCGDYRSLNTVQTADRYPMPHIVDLTASLAGKRIFSKIDLIRAYNQIPVAEADIAKTAVTTSFGLFEFLRMPFGLKNAAPTFRRFIDQVCHGLNFDYAYLDDILNFTADIWHVSGVHNAVADALSCIQAISAAAGTAINLAAMATAPLNDPELDLLRRSDSLDIRLVQLTSADGTILCDLSLGTPRPVVPREFRQTVIDALHGLSHPGVRASVKLVTARVVWRSVNWDVRTWAAACLPCQRAKVHKRTSSLGTLPTPDARFHHVHVDLKTPVYVPEKLSTCSHVLLRADGVRQPLQSPYIEPFKVLHRASKAYTIDRGGRHEVVTIDRLKPAFMEETTSPISSSSASCDVKTHPTSLQHHSPVQPDHDLGLQAVPTSPGSSPLPPTTNCRGREVHKPAQFSDYVQCKYL
ncbi:unnamed protein product [Dicrocoelium dendriticum]|nr:unnamed protein product [Dicrocoelium dendriticum]